MAVYLRENRLSLLKPYIWRARSSKTDSLLDMFVNPPYVARPAANYYWTMLQNAELCLWKNFITRDLATAPAPAGGQGGLAPFGEILAPLATISSSVKKSSCLCFTRIINKL